MLDGIELFHVFVEAHRQRDLHGIAEKGSTLSDRSTVIAERHDAHVLELAAVGTVLQLVERLVRGSVVRGNERHLQVAANDVAV